jgi:hypothetical protein
MYLSDIDLLLQPIKMKNHASALKVKVHPSPLFLSSKNSCFAEEYQSTIGFKTSV